MKFQVRDGFVIHDTKVVEIGGKPTTQENSYYGGQSVDFDEDTAAANLHKLEPLDKAATAFVTARFMPEPVLPSQGIAVADVQKMIDAAVASALAIAAEKPKAAA